MDTDIYLIHNFTQSLHKTELNLFKLFEHIIVGYMFNKTIIFDSDWNDFLKISDKVCVIDKQCSVAFYGRYQDFIQN